MRVIVYALAVYSLSACVVHGNNTQAKDVETLNFDGQLCLDIVDDHVLAIEHCNIAIDSGELTHQEFTDTLVNRGWHYARLGQSKLAIADYTSVIELGVPPSTAYYNRGSMYERLGDLSRARADFSEAYRLTPNLQSNREKAEEYGIIE